MNQDRARFENRCVVIDERRDFPVRIDLQKIGFVLIALADVHPMRFVLELELLQKDERFDAVGGGLGMEMDHLATEDNHDLALVIYGLLTFVSDEAKSSVMDFTPRPITEVARELGLSEDEIDLYGKTKAKIALAALERPATAKGRLIL